MNNADANREGKLPQLRPKNSLMHARNALSLTQRILLPLRDRRRRELMEWLVQWKGTLALLSREYPFRFSELEKYKHILDWNNVSLNKRLDLNKATLLHFDKYWKGVLSNPALKWSPSIIDHYWDAIHWADSYGGHGYCKMQRPVNPSAYVDHYFFRLAHDYFYRFASGYYGLRFFKSNQLPVTEEIIQYLNFDLESFWDYKYINLTSDLLDKYKTSWNWKSLSKSCAVPWSINIISRYFDYWHWKELSGNEAIPWSEELIDRYAENWDWMVLNANRAIPWTERLITKYSDRIDFGVLRFGSLTLLSIAFLERTQDKWDWDGLSYNVSLRWSSDLIERFKDRWNWHWLSSEKYIYTGDEKRHCRPVVPLTPTMIDRFIEYWDWDRLSRNPFMIEFNAITPLASERINWAVASSISYNKMNWYDDSGDPWLSGDKNPGVGKRPDTIVPWSIELLEKHEDKWDWGKLGENVDIALHPHIIERFREKWGHTSLAAIPYDELIKSGRSWSLLCESETLQWTIELIDRYQHNFTKAEWWRLSANRKVIWSQDLLDKYAEYWDWDCLSENPSLPWSVDLIEAYIDKLHWLKLCGHVKLSAEEAIVMIERHEKTIHWEEMSANIQLQWNYDLIEKFRKEWNWYNLGQNIGIAWDAELISRFKEDLVKPNRPVLKPVMDQNGMVFGRAYMWEGRGEYPGLQGLCENKGIKWDVNLLREYKEMIDWTELSGRSDLPWNQQFMWEFIEYLQPSKVLYDKVIKPYIDNDFLEELLSRLDGFQEYGGHIGRSAE